MALSKGFRLNSATTPLDYRLATQGMLARASGGGPRPGILHSGTADGNIITRSSSALQVTLLDQVVLALARAIAGTDGVDILTNVGALVQNLNAPTANSWYVTLWARQNDNTGAGGAADADSLPTFGATYGAASASPAVPAAPTGATKIGHILIPSTATTAQSTGVVYTETIQHTTVVGGRIRYRNTTEMNADIANLSDGALAFVRSGDLYFLKGGAWVDLNDDTGWIDAPLANGWTSVTNYKVQYRRLRGIVFIRGAATTSGSSTTMFTLPVGFRPGSLMRVAILNGTTQSATLLAIPIDVGGVVAAGVTNTVNFTSLSFPADN